MDSKTSAGTRRPLPCRGWAGWVGVFLCALPLVAACEPIPAGTVAKTELWGRWRIREAGCEQTLSLSSTGQFRLALRGQSPEGTFVSTVGGGLRMSQLEDGSTGITFLPTTPVPEETVIYCRQWAAARQFSLAAEGESQSLRARGELSKIFQNVLVGTAADGTDRAAVFLWPDGSPGRAVLDDGGRFPSGGYGSKQTREAGTILGRNAVPMPGRSYYNTYPGVAVGITVDRFYLNVIATTDIGFAVPADGANLPACLVSLYSDVGFFSKTRGINPNDVADTGRTLHVEPGSSPELLRYLPVGSGEAVYLLPVGLESSTAAGCGIAIRGRERALSLLEGRGLVPAETSARLSVPQGWFEPDPVFPGRARWAGFPLSIVGASNLFPNRFLSFPSLAGTPDGGGSDLLGLLTGGRVLRAISGQGEQGVYLNLIGVGGAGLGTFEAAPESGIIGRLSHGDTARASFEAAGGRHLYELIVSGDGRLALWSEGGLPVTGLLRDEDGDLLAANRGGGQDAAGFYLERSLAPGSYWLELRAADPGGYTVSVGTPADSGVPDEELWGCLIAHGILAGALPIELDCQRWGIRDLTGIGKASGIRRLRLGGNHISDGSPLADLNTLWELSLDGNGIGDLAFLAGFDRLERLSLRGLPLDTSDLLLLSTVAAGASYLDLTDVTGLSERDISRLRAMFPGPVLVDPDGIVWE